MKTVSFYALGCRVNQYEEQALKELFKKHGYTVVSYGEKCNACVINTCAVTAESEKKSRNIISRARNFADRVIVTGCYAELLSKNKSALQGVFYVGGCKQKNLIPLIADGEIDSAYDHTAGYEEYGICTDNSLPAERYRAFVKIQDGCNGKCSYCIIPYLRGRSVSRKADDVIDEVRRLAAAGVSEIILTGIETSDYDDIPLFELINRVSDVDGIKRIRLGSLNPNCLTDEFIETFKSNPKLCHHVHISLQSGCNRILNLMRRPYNIEKADRVITKIKTAVPDLLISADIISGFPTETDADHNETLTFIEKNNLAHVHAFPYSERPYTDAINIKPSVDVAVRKKRNDEIIRLSEALRNAIMDKYIGNDVEILVEKQDNGTAIGHTATFLTATVKSDAAPGSYIIAHVCGHDENLIANEIIL
ncbi:MAG: tRNA (N(6)-L-threonylcarbamoyladenosine(37)-C(2))-methylthiotransferase MtaB [Ruminococcus sp.]|nr:tRNA (N(6)-L-threonylcarbamoyladenosine(37)-C(2))-methylthiotransferase MtaB [Ruminococcus sp.]